MSLIHANGERVRNMMRDDENKAINVSRTYSYTAMC